MAIKSRNISSDGHRVMTLDEFKRWLQRFDTNKDGRMSKKELQEVIEMTGGWFAQRKSRHMVDLADSNHDGFIDDKEVGALVDFAYKQLGVKIVASSLSMKL